MALLRAGMAQRFAPCPPRFALLLLPAQIAVPFRHLTLLVLISLLLCSAANALDLNLATEAELDSVKGLGPSTTARILAARQTQPFQSWLDFMRRVKGVKAAAATKLSVSGVTIDGAPYIAAKITGATSIPSTLAPTEPPEPSPATSPTSPR